jgi:DeoR family deoxyribose operon repressor
MSQNINVDEKRIIGNFAASLIESGDVIIIDTGTTTEHLVYNIPDDLKITALCFNFNIVNQLLNRKQIHLLFAGGVYHKNTQMCESPEGIQLINRTRATKVFLSAAGISEQLGITCVNQYEVESKKAIIKAALQKILLADSSKFNKIRPALFAQLSDVDVIVTDNGITAGWIEIIRNRGIALHIAKST